MDLMRVALTEGMRERAEAKALQIPENIRNSILHGAGRFDGCLGEEVFLWSFPKAISQNTFTYDVMLQAYTFEIKTKRRNVVPEPSFDCSIPKASEHQNPDFYVFISLYKDALAFICGYISRHFFYRKAWLRPEGDVDETNNQVEQAPGGSYHIPIEALWPATDLEGLQAPRLWSLPPV